LGRLAFGPRSNKGHGDAGPCRGQRALERLKGAEVVNQPGLVDVATVQGRQLVEGVPEVVDRRCGREPAGSTLCKGHLPDFDSGRIEHVFEFI